MKFQIVHSRIAAGTLCALIGRDFGMNSLAVIVQSESVSECNAADSTGERPGSSVRSHVSPKVGGIQIHLTTHLTFQLFGSRGHSALRARTGIPLKE